jgi:SNF2 family DNA or RNA helicase
MAPILEGAGFGLLVPPWWNRPGARLGLKVKMKPGKSKESAAKGRMTMENLVSYEWQLSLGGTSLTEEEFQALAALKSPLVQLRGQWVMLDPEQIEAALKFWEKQQTSGEISLLEALQYSLGGEAERGGLPVEEVVSEGWLAEWLERFKGSERMSELPQPDGLRGELRPYQRFGYSWLSFHRQWGLGACLADDMGLGKTIQTLALLLREKGQRSGSRSPALIICPTSVVTNWEREIERFAPDLHSYVHRGADRLRGGAFRKAVRGKDVVLTSYPLVRLDAETMQSMPWLAVILDEAQNIKNPSAKQTQAVRQVKAEFRVALTGTPVENRLSELWSIMHFLNPGYLGSREKFRSDFALPIERYQDEQALKRLKQMVDPFVLRRVKTDPRVISDLPAKVETKVYCTLTEEQATLYQAVVQDAMKKIEELEGIERRGLVLSMLMQLKQICNHPVQYLHQSGKKAAEATLEGRSGKLERLAALLEEVLSEGDRALIFTQFAEMGALLADFLPKATGAATQFLHGGTPVKLRDHMVRHFQEDEHAPPIFILSLKAGGTGLNLTRASHVFHFDRWWNPAVEDQATDRAFRIGQRRNVQVHKFVTTGTLEEMIDDMIESKKGLAQAVVGSGENWLTELSTDELRDLVALRRE